MRKGLWFTLGLLAGLFISVLILVGAIFGWQTTLAASIPEPSDLPPAQTPADLQSQVDDLSRRIDKLENDQFFTLREIERKMDEKLLILSSIALLISFLAGFLGYKTYNDLDMVIKEKVNSSLEKALYQLDPTYLPIHIYKGRVRRNLKEGETPRTTARDSLSDVSRRLELTGLLNVGEITYLYKVTQTGITIVPIDDETDEDEFIKFVKDGKVKLDPEKAGFILYAPFGYTIKKAQTAFENTTIANMPATVASMVLVVGRGLKNTKPQTVKEESK